MRTDQASATAASFTAKDYDNAVSNVFATKGPRFGKAFFPSRSILFSACAIVSLPSLSSSSFKFSKNEMIRSDRG